MANFSSDQKYLDKYGLSLFWDKVRQYIQNQIGGIDGTDVKLYPSGETNPTVTDQIEKLWNSIGSGELEGGISGSIEAILGQYVKDIQHADSQTTPLKVVVNEGTENEADFYTVTLEDNGLANTLSDLTTNRVSSLDPVNGGGSVTLEVDKNKGDVTLTINSQELTNKVSGLETTIDGMVKSVNKAENGDGTYVKLNIDPITGDVKLSINDQSLVSELTSIKDNYVKTEDLPTTLPNPHKFTLTYRDKENQEKVVVYDGSSAKDVDFSLYHATTSTTATRVSNSLKVVDANGTAYDYNGGIMVDLSGGINYAANSGKLGGQLPSYYGKQSDITTISQKIAELEALTHVNQITAGDGDSDLVKIGFDVSTGNVVASIDETNLSNKLTSIDNYTINSKKISTNPVLTGSDITLGTTVGDNVNYPTTTTLTSSIQKLRETIAGLGQVVELKGVLSSLPATTEGYGNGDVVIVGNKEYICYNSVWYLLGDTTELSQDVSTIKSSYVKSIQATGTGVTVSPTTPSAGDVTIEIDATPITDAISELEANFGNYYTKTQVNTELAKYLLLSGGTMSGPISGLTNLTSAGNITATEYGFRLSSTQYDGYIWNTVAGKGISIGLIDNGSTSSANASLNIKGSNIYPGTSNKFSLGTDSLKFKDIFADGRVISGRFLTGTKTKAVLESDTNSGLSITTQVPLNGSTAGDYGFNATNNANGVLAFRTHTGSGADYMHYLGFSNDGEIYHTAQNAQFAGWRNLTNPFGSILMPRTIDKVHSRAVIPNMLNEGIVNIFNYPLKSELLIERSQDGSTWIDVTEDEYENFRCGFTKGYNQGGNRYVAYDKTNGQVGDRLRITYIPNNRYCSMGYLDVYYTTRGATTTFTFELNNKNDETTWVKVHDSKSCTGWPGHNYYGLSGYSFGQTNGSNYYACRMTFEITAVSSSYNNLGVINYIYGFTDRTPYSVCRDSYFRYDVASQAYRITAHIIPSSTGYELGNQQFPFKNIITQSLGISLGSGCTPNYITSDTNRNMFIKIADVIPFVADCADTNNPVIRPSVSMGSKVDLGTTGQPWKNVYATKFVTTGGTSSQVVLGDGTLKAISDISTGGEANVQSDWNVTDTTSDAYIKNKPTIPTVGNGTITITQNGTTKGSFTVNQTGNTTIELTDTGITSQDHYTPAEDTSAAITATGGTATNITGTSGKLNVVTGLKRDAKGHVVGVTCANIYSTDNASGGTVTSITPGTGLTGTSSDTAITSSGTINLKVASSSEIGGVKPGTTNGKTYGVAVSSTGEMTVNVPWTDTDTKVTQTATESNANYPILLAPSTQTATTTGAAYFETAIKINPSTRKITGVDYISSDSTDLHIQCDEWLILDGGGDGCGIRPNSSSINDCDLGTTSIRFRNGYFSNQVFAANGFYESSDERLKDFGEGLRVDLDALSKLRKSYFTFKDKPENPQIGVSAQEIQKLYPEVVIETSDGHLNVDYAKLSVVALAAIDQLNDKVKSLEDRLARLEKLLENK